MNVDPQEVKKFDDIADQWWDQDGPCKPLHDLNPLRLAFIQSCCTLSGCSVLDIGSGGGILTESLSHFAREVYGIDQSLRALECAKKHAESLTNPPQYEHTTAEKFADVFPHYFDIITCMELLEHVPSPLSIIEASAKMLKPGGDLFFSTLNRTPKSFLYAIIGAEYILKILPRNTHKYENFIRPSELAEWSRKQHLSLKHIKGISYDLIRKTYFLSNNVAVNYLIHLKKEPA